MPWSDSELAAKVAADLQDGWHVNLGIGLPTGVIDRIPADREVVLQSENGILGVAPLAGEPDPDVVHAGKDSVSVMPGGSFFDSVTSFAMIRGGRMDAALLGAYEVSTSGDISNWRTNSQRLSGRIGGVGGAADLAVGARRLWVMMRHRTRDGQPKIVRECQLPLTAAGKVTRIYTDWAVCDVTPEALLIRDLAPGISEADVRAHTAGELDFSPLASRAASREGDRNHDAYQAPDEPAETAGKA